MRHLFFFSALVCLLLGCVDHDQTGEGEKTNLDLTLDDDQPMKIAVIGDTGIGSGFSLVLDLIKRQKATMVLHAGDLGYIEGNKQIPENFMTMINSKLGSQFLYFFGIGNHDLSLWFSAKTAPYRSYQDLLTDKIRRYNLPCVPNLGDAKMHGQNSYCVIKDMLIIFSSVGTLGYAGDNERFLEDTLTKHADKPWKFCVWHKNQHDMQLGHKRDEVGWRPYQLCQDHGAIILTAHEHSYARSYSLTALGNRSKSHGKKGEPDNLVVKPGSTFVVVSGLGGKTARTYDCRSQKDVDWWASINTTNYVKINEEVERSLDCSGNESLVNPGALFLTHHGDSFSGEFIDVAGNTIDRFQVHRE